MNRRDFLKSLAIATLGVFGINALDKPVRTGQLKWKDEPATITWTTGKAVLSYYNQYTQTWEVLDSANDMKLNYSPNRIYVNGTWKWRDG